MTQETAKIHEAARPVKFDKNFTRTILQILILVKFMHCITFSYCVVNNSLFCLVNSSLSFALIT